ncbi:MULTISPECIES: ankyrin repeat domain-containing protein [Glycomyces]|uniref:Ankyrin repeat domain-containing protein n=2 Tax=Glycomyces TaxID=58113 RepID=A0A9X3PTL7_9ACTN|nr:ankyrin repeat domain-containing protein [Glycomyces lechevalierae]MDA1385253.1 ankyrin repeat domain-containing protein [Glycomyces lechevalierae]MDR7337130.1 hypothetical protein [Glycomyces lechevalierae]
MDIQEIVQLLADVDAGRPAGPRRSGGYVVVGYNPEAVIDEDDEDYDEDLEHLEVWGTAATAAEAFEKLGGELATTYDDAVRGQWSNYFEEDMEDDEFEEEEGKRAALALLALQRTPGREALFFLFSGYYAPMEFITSADWFDDFYLGAAAGLFPGARLLFGASAASPHQDEAVAVFELQPVDREDGPNSLDARGMSPLHHAVAGGDLAEVAALLASGADPNLQAEYGNAPLFAAADAKGRTASALEALDDERWAVTKALLDHGADIDARDRSGRSIVDLAADGSAEIRDELRARGGRAYA